MPITFLLLKECLFKREVIIMTYLKFSVMVLFLTIVGCGQPIDQQISDIRLASVITRSCALQLQSLDRFVPASQATQDMTWELIRDTDHNITALTEGSRTYTLENSVAVEQQTSGGFKLLASDEDLSLTSLDSKENFSVLFVKEGEGWIQANLHVAPRQEFEKIQAAQKQGQTLETLPEMKAEACYTHAYKTVSSSLESSNKDEVANLESDQIHTVTSFRALRLDKSTNTNKGQDSTQYQATFSVELPLSSDDESPVRFSFTQPTDEFNTPSSIKDTTNVEVALFGVTNSSSSSASMLKSKSFYPFEFVFDVTLNEDDNVTLTLSDGASSLNQEVEDDKGTQDNKESSAHKDNMASSSAL